MAVKRKRKVEGTEEAEASAVPSVHRCDRLSIRANHGKAGAVHAMLRLWRDAAGTVTAAEWRRFQATGRFDAVADVATDHRKAGAAVRATLIRQVADRHGVAVVPSDPGAKKRLPKMTPGLVDPFAGMKATLGAAQTQMVRRQVVGMLDGFVTNRMKDFVRTVFRSSLDETTRHHLFAVNKARAWFDMKREVLVQSKKGGAYDTPVPADVRRLARKVMSTILVRHRRPSMKRIGMSVDRRIAKLEPTGKASAFPFWLKFIVGRNRPIHLPVTATPPFLARQGTRSLSFGVNADRETGRLTVGVTHDVGETCRIMRGAYAATASGTLRLDFGLSTLFVSDRGDLVGRNFLDKLKRLDRTIQGIARHVQRTGGRLRSSERYRRHVVRLRGFVTTMVNWALTRLVMKHRPEALVLERLDFRSPDLSKRMNRILSACGRKAVRDKLKTMEEELGVVATLEPCAWTSQTCSGCGYVDGKNRTDQARFECLWCGMKMHADANAARNLGSERFRPPTGTYGRAARDAVLAALVTGHGERWTMERRKPLHGRTRERGAPPDPRRTNPYFRDWCVKARSDIVGGRASGRKKLEGQKGRTA